MCVRPLGGVWQSPRWSVSWTIATLGPDVGPLQTAGDPEGLSRDTLGPPAAEMDSHHPAPSTSPFPQQPRPHSPEVEVGLLPVQCSEAACSSGLRSTWLPACHTHQHLACIGGTFMKKKSREQEAKDGWQDGNERWHHTVHSFVITSESLTWQPVVYGWQVVRNIEGIYRI